MKVMQIVPRIAIDFGSTHIRATANKSNPVYSTRSLLVRKVVTGEVVAIGDEAADYVLDPGEELVTPIKNGVMVDYQAGVSLLRHTLSQVLSWWHVFQPQVVVAESLQLSSAVSQALGEAVQEAGGGRVYLTSVPTLAALGAGIDPAESTGSFILDIGGGTTEAAVITRGSAAISRSISVGGSDIISAICTYIKERHQVSLSHSVADEILKSVGTALRRDTDHTHDFYANETETGEAMNLTITGNEVAEAVSKPLQQITDLVREIVKKTPTTLLSDVARSGVVVTGGVGNLDNLDTYIERELSLPVQIKDKPEMAVISGGREALQFISMYEQSVPQANN